MPKSSQSALHLVALAVVLIGSTLLRFWGFADWSLTNDELSALTRLQYDSLNDILKLGIDLCHRFDAFPKKLVITEHSGMGLHCFLHFQTKIGGWNIAFRIAEMIEASQCQIGAVFR